MKLIKALLSAVLLVLCGCGDDENTDAIKFVVSADYPPFTFMQDGEIVGFEIDLANEVAKKLNKKAHFQDIPFNSITAIISTGQADAAISAIAKTEERAKNFEFSVAYYYSPSNMVVVLKKPHTPVKDVSGLMRKKVACQLGSVMEIWVKDKLENMEIQAKAVSLDSVPQIIESVLSGQADAAIIEPKQATELLKRHRTLVAYEIAAENQNGYRIMLSKGSKLLEAINEAIQTLVIDGTIEKLEKKWLHAR